MARSWNGFLPLVVACALGGCFAGPAEPTEDARPATAPTSTAAVSASPASPASAAPRDEAVLRPADWSDGAGWDPYGDRPLYGPGGYFGNLGGYYPNNGGPSGFYVPGGYPYGYPYGAPYPNYGVPRPILCAGGVCWAY
jgi:hypothetical protein